MHGVVLEVLTDQISELRIPYCGTVSHCGVYCCASCICVCTGIKLLQIIHFIHFLNAMLCDASQGVLRQ